MNSLLAYLDPGTGSLLLQVLVGGFAGILVLLKWLRDWFLAGSFRKGNVSCPEELSTSRLKPNELTPANQTAVTSDE